jgi:hypothetical protein
LSTTVGTRTTSIYIGRYTVRTRLPAAWVAVFAVTFVGTSCLLLVPNLVGRMRSNEELAPQAETAP